MVTYLLPAKWPFLHAIPHPFQLGWLILSIFDNVIAEKKSPFPLRIFFFLSASEAEVCVWHICISSSVLPFHILCYFSTGLFLLIVITRTFLCILGSNNLTMIYIANTVTSLLFLF